MERKAEHNIARRLKVLNHAIEHGNISKLAVILGFVVKLFTRGDAHMKQVVTRL